MIARMIRAADPKYLTAHIGKWGFPPRTPEHACYHVADRQRHLETHKGALKQLEKAGQMTQWQ